MNTMSIFQEYYHQPDFFDLYQLNKYPPIDVIIPVIHTNELWKTNLISLYREIPINRLLISDGGCIDNTIDIVKEFPRVQIFDHKHNKSLGYSIKLLIETVETEWFAYLHSDVYLPDKWYEKMMIHQKKYDWFGCTMQHTILIEYNNQYGERPWAGAQIGRKNAFMPGLEKIDDDFIYRQEDFIWRKIIQDNGKKEGFIKDVFHYHQTMYKPSPSGRNIKSLQLSLEMTKEEEIKTWLMQIKGIIKYLSPDSKWVIDEIQVSLMKVLELEAISYSDLIVWTKKTNPQWLPYLSRNTILKKAVKKRVTFFWNFIRQLLS